MDTVEEGLKPPMTRAERRRKAYELSCLGLSTAEISRELGVTRPTVTADLQQERAKVAEGLERYDPGEAIAGHISYLTYRLAEAQRGYALADSPSEKRAWLQMGRLCQADLLSLEMKVGLIPKDGGAEHLSRSPGTEGLPVYSGDPVEATIRSLEALSKNPVSRWLLRKRLPELAELVRELTK